MIPGKDRKSARDDPTTRSGAATQVGKVPPIEPVGPPHCCELDIVVSKKSYNDALMQAALQQFAAAGLDAQVVAGTGPGGTAQYTLHVTDHKSRP